MSRLQGVEKGVLGGLELGLGPGWGEERFGFPFQPPPSSPTVVTERRWTWAWGLGEFCLHREKNGLLKQTPWRRCHCTQVASLGWSCGGRWTHGQSRGLAHVRLCSAVTTVAWPGFVLRCPMVTEWPCLMLVMCEILPFAGSHQGFGDSQAGSSFRGRLLPPAS